MSISFVLTALVRTYAHLKEKTVLSAVRRSIQGLLVLAPARRGVRSIALMQVTVQMRAWVDSEVEEVPVRTLQASSGKEADSAAVAAPSDQGE